MDNPAASSVAPTETTWRLMDSPALMRAIEQWERGNTIPLTLAVELMAEGFDVEKLEAEYRT